VKIMTTMSTYNNGEECKMESPDEDDRDLRSGTGRESEDCWGE